MSTLVVGDTSLETRNITVIKHGSGQLLDANNFFLADFDSPTVYFTALGDLGFDQIVEAAMQAEHVEFLFDDLRWQDLGARYQTEILCNYLSHRRHIHGASDHQVDCRLTKSVSRTSTDPMIWTFGCSTTAGAGLSDPQHESYGALLSQRLNRSWCNVAQNGTSTKWSLLHIMAAEIAPQDIVVWGTTSAERYQHAVDYNTTKETLLADADRNVVDFYTDPQIYWSHLDTVNMGIKYLRALKSQFIFVNLLHISPYSQLLEREFSRHREWCYVHDWNRHDRGLDKIHIGPKGHINLANRIETHIKLLNYV